MCNRAVEEDFSPGWQARAGARFMANALEIRMRAAERDSSSLVLLGRYIRRARGYAFLTQDELADASGVSQSTISRLEAGIAEQLPMDRLMAINNALGALLPLGCCPHDHKCAWQPFRPPRVDDKAQAFLDYLLREGGEASGPGAGAHDAADTEFGVELDEIGALAGGEAAAIVDAEQLEGVARRRGDRGG
jgi:transcriptional regulator with XRE-family HTH domain